MKRTLLIILVFTGVFVCGGVVGGALTFRFGHPFVQKRGADQVMFQQWRELGDKLELTPEQKKKVRPIIGRAIKDRQGAQRQMQVVMERMLEDLEALLTPEQRAKYKTHVAQQRLNDRQWQRWMRDQRENRPGPPPMGPDGKPLPMPPFMERRERDRERPPGGPRPAETTAPTVPPASSGGSEAAMPSR